MAAFLFSNPHLICLWNYTIFYHDVTYKNFFRTGKCCLFFFFLCLSLCLAEKFFKEIKMWMGSLTQYKKRVALLENLLFTVCICFLLNVIFFSSHKECDNSPVPVHEQFPGYFRTREQQEALEDLVFKKQSYYPVNYSVAMGYECDTKCSAYDSVNSSKGVQFLTNDVCCLRWKGEHLYAAFLCFLCNIWCFFNWFQPLLISFLFGW